MKNVCVGLFGTCGGSKWRDDFITSYETLDVDYFNPDAGDNWHPGLVDEENRHLLEDEIILFPVLAESLGLGSLAEIGFSVLNVIQNIERGSNQHLIVMIDDDCTAANSTASEIDHSQRTRRLVKSKLIKVTHPNVIVVRNLNAMLVVSQGLIQVDKLKINIA